MARVNRRRATYAAFLNALACCGFYPVRRTRCLAVGVVMDSFVLRWDDLAECRAQPTRLYQPSIYSKTARRSPALQGTSHIRLRGRPGRDDARQTQRCVGKPANFPTMRVGKVLQSVAPLALLGVIMAGCSGSTAPYCGSWEHDHKSRSTVLGANEHDGTIVICFWPDGLRDDCRHLPHPRGARGCHHPRQPDHGNRWHSGRSVAQRFTPGHRPRPRIQHCIRFHWLLGVGSLVPVNLSTGTAGSSVGTVQAEDVAVTPDGKTAYVSSGASQIYPVSLTIGANPLLNVGNPISVETGADAIALTPDGKTAYVTGESAPGVITPVDLANGASANRSQWRQAMYGASPSAPTAIPRT